MLLYYLNIIFRRQVWERHQWHARTVLCPPLQYTFSSVSLTMHSCRVLYTCLCVCMNVFQYVTSTVTTSISRPSDIHVHRLRVRIGSTRRTGIIEASVAIWRIPRGNNTIRSDEHITGLTSQGIQCLLTSSQVVGLALRAPWRHMVQWSAAPPTHTLGTRQIQSASGAGHFTPK